MGRLSYLLDSNILSEPSRLHPNVHVQSRLLAHRHAVCTAALVLHEMYYGVALMPDGRRKQALTHYLEQAVHQQFVAPKPPSIKSCARQSIWYSIRH
jgi:predicted nucleic acid-binding protein